MKTLGERQTSSTIASHLLDALTVGKHKRKSILPSDIVTLILVFSVLAASGPVWNKVPSPWFSESAPLVIAIEVSDSMRSNDVLPTRLDRARFKVLDLVEAVHQYLAE